MSGIFVLLMIVFVCWLIIRPRRRGRTWTITEENPIGVSVRRKQPQIAKEK